MNCIFISAGAWLGLQEAVRQLSERETLINIWAASDTTSAAPDKMEILSKLCFKKS